MKKCKYCKSEIEETCQKCPKCNEWQNSWKNPNVKIGFSMILIGLGFLIASNVWSHKYQTANALIFKTFSSQENHKIVILWHKLNSENGRSIIGEIENQGHEAFSSLTLEAEIFKGKDEFTSLLTTFIPGAFRPGEKRYFEIKNDGSCSGASGHLDNLSSYELRVVDGFFLK